MGFQPTLKDSEKQEWNLENIFFQRFLNLSKSHIKPISFLPWFHFMSIVSFNKYLKIFLEVFPKIVLQLDWAEYLYKVVT